MVYVHDGGGGGGASWQDIFGLDEPVRGKTYEFSRARRTFENWRDDAQHILDSLFSSEGFDNHLNQEPGQLLKEFLEEVHSGLTDLPPVADRAATVLRQHYDELLALRGEASEALSRARTAWNDKNRLEPQATSLWSQITSLANEISCASPDEDTSAQESRHGSLLSQHRCVSDELDAANQTLSDVENNVWPDLRDREDSLNDTTGSDLRSIELGDLKDPGLFERWMSAIGNFVGGFLESLVNMVEAFLTGDWATFFWELKNVLDTVLLVLGTIALFTGIGTPLGIFVLGATLASTAITAGLYFTQTPNPQTGETISGMQFGMSVVGSAFAGAGVLRTLGNMRAVNSVRGIVPTAHGGTLRSQFAHMQFSSFGFRNGSLAGLHSNWSRHLTNFRNGNPVSTSNSSFTWANVHGRGNHVTVALQQQGIITTGWNTYGTVTGIHNRLQSDTWANGSGGFSGNVQYSPDWGAMWIPGAPLPLPGFGTPGTQGTPVFSDRPSPQQIDLVVDQAAQSPNVHIVPAN